jgi:hypothetical protein
VARGSWNVKVDHSAVAAATAAAATRVLEEAGTLGERMIRVWQAAVGDPAFKQGLENHLAKLEAALGIDDAGHPLPKAAPAEDDVDDDTERSTDDLKPGEWG